MCTIVVSSFKYRRAKFNYSVDQNFTPVSHNTILEKIFTNNVKFSFVIRQAPEETDWTSCVFAKTFLQTYCEMNWIAAAPVNMKCVHDYKH